MNVPRLGNLVKEKIRLVLKFAESEAGRFLKSITYCALRGCKKRALRDAFRNWVMENAASVYGFGHQDFQNFRGDLRFLR